MQMNGSGGDTANGSADGGGGTGTTDTSRSGLPKRTKARIKWMRREHAKDHAGATVMNGRLRRGEYGRKGCYVTPEDLNCQFCAMAKMRARARSNVHARVRPGMVLSHWSWDVYEPPKEFHKNRDGWRYIFGAIDLGSGYIYVMFSRGKTAQDCLRFVKGLQKKVNSMAPLAYTRWGYVPKVSMLRQDCESGSTTVNGYTTGIVDEWLQAEGIEREMNKSRTHHKNGSAEVMWRTLRERSGAQLAGSGMLGEFYFDSAETFVFNWNESSGTESNKIGSTAESPAVTCGQSDRSSLKRDFGSTAWWHNDGTLSWSGEEHAKQKSG
jgi:hypothetical protein